MPIAFADVDREVIDRIENGMCSRHLGKVFLIADALSVPDRAAGLLTDRGRQHTDSSHVRAAARDLTRLELVTEAVRAAPEILARDAEACGDAGGPQRPPSTDTDRADVFYRSWS